MIKFLLISALIIYTVIALYNYFSTPLKEGYRETGDKKSRESSGRLEVTHNPMKGKAKKGIVGEYTDFEEVKDKDPQ